MKGSSRDDQRDGDEEGEKEEEEENIGDAPEGRRMMMMMEGMGGEHVQYQAERDVPASAVMF